MESKIHSHHHHILPTRTAVTIGVVLLCLTAITVEVAHLDLGPLNFFVAMAVASVKALLVALFFMNLWFDRKENAVIFGTSFLFLTIFIVLTATDLFFRGDVYVKGPLLAASQSKSTVKQPWISTPTLIAHGKELYQVQCATCHGVEGEGNGPAASALNPKPRNFHSAEGWKNGRSPTMVFKTLKEGLPPSAMASYVTLPPDDRWALSHYVLSLGPQPPQKDTPQDFAKIGVDPNQEFGGTTESPTIPIDIALERMEVPDLAHAQANSQDLSHQALANSETSPVSRGAQIYREACLQCHGEKAQGGIKTQLLLGYPASYVTTMPLTTQLETMKSQADFNRIVTQGIPGELMPGNAQLSFSDLQDLYSYIINLLKK